MSEKWREIYSVDQINKLQKIERDCLFEFIRVCERLEIEYVLYGGTLLGAIKYDGFIPWDDDIDVALTRDNYNRFLSEAPGIISDKYVIQSPYSEPKSPYVYTKLRKKGTKYIEQYHHKLDIEKGVYIDIYAIDNIPDNEELRKKQYMEVRKWILKYYYRQCLHISLPIIGFKRIKNAIGQIMYYVIGRMHSQEYYIKHIEKLMTKYNDIDTKRKACLYSPNYDNIYIKFYPLITHQFEGKEVTIPFCFDDHLRRRYGDYKLLPPEEKRIGHIPYEIEL